MQLAANGRVSYAIEVVRLEFKGERGRLGPCAGAHPALRNGSSVSEAGTRRKTDLQGGQMSKRGLLTGPENRAWLRQQRVHSAQVHVFQPYGTYVHPGRGDR
jgi:hypothetical protein